jgi:hypothetical protein
MKRVRRPWLWLGVGIVCMVLLTLIVAPIQGTAQRAGSSYSRAPDGYGAWYRYMQAQPGVCIGRWHHALRDLKGAGTLIQVLPSLGSDYLSDVESEWVSRGNTLIRLGVESDIVDAPFTSQVTSSQGLVSVETRRRGNPKLINLEPTRKQGQDLEPWVIENRQPLLSDQHGVIVWQWPIGNGRLIVSSTPYLGANAYQKQPGNYQFLAVLATPKQGAIWMDETRFGYHSAQQVEQQARDEPIPSACESVLAQAYPSPLRDKASGQRKDPPNAFVYLIKTPIGLVLLQAFIAISLLMISKNRRFGLPLPLPSEEADNTLSYIQALATVLYKARCHGFVVTSIQQAEQRSLQQRLGLGTELLEPHQVLETWQSMGYAPELLRQALISPPVDQCREQDLLTWLEAWQTVKATLTPKTNPVSSV